MKVRDAVRRIEQDGWVLQRTRGSHRQFRRPFKPGTVTIAGSLSQDVPAGTLNSILKQAGLMIGMEYLVVVEKSSSGFGAYVPDLPGCVAVAESRSGVVRLIREAIKLHIDDLIDSGNPVPPPSSQAEVVSVHAA